VDSLFYGDGNSLRYACPFAKIGDLAFIKPNSTLVNLGHQFAGTNVSIECPDGYLQQFACRFAIYV
jgi:hypothetical protein